MRANNRSTRRGYSLASLLVTIAVIGLCLTMIRFATSGMDTTGDRYHKVMGLIVSSGVLGALFGGVLTIWNRHGIGQVLAGIPGGAVIGAAGGALATITVPWHLVAAIPLVVIVPAYLRLQVRIARERQRTVGPWDERGDDRLRWG